MFDIHYRFQLSDFTALIAAQQQRNKRRGRVATAILWTILGLLALGLVWSALQGDLDISTYFFLGAVALFIVLFRLFGVPLLRRFQYQRSGLENQQMQLKLDDNGWTFQQRGMTTSGDWAKCENLMETQAHIFIWLSRREALIIPRRSVPEVQADGLLSFLVARIPSCSD